MAAAALSLSLSLSLAGRTALVTGAATGIGRAIALAFAQAGAAVVVNHLGRSEQADALVQEIHHLGGQAWALEADVSQSADVTRLAAQVQQVCGGLDVLVNNAGIIQEKPFLQTTEADWDQMLGVDLKSVFLTCRAFLPGMLARQSGVGAIQTDVLRGLPPLPLGEGGPHPNPLPEGEGISPCQFESRQSGVIINIASDLALLGRAQFAPYCAAKAGVIGLTRSLAREFAPQIRVNAIAPGPVATAMVSLEAMSLSAIDQELEIPQHRIAEPQEIAATALFLASDLSRFYCGQVLGPNGGSVMP